MLKFCSPHGKRDREEFMVNPGSKAALRGIREGDLITSINGLSTKDISNADAHNLLKNVGDTLKLGLNEDCDGSPKRRLYKTVHQETRTETIKKSSTSSHYTSTKILQSQQSDNQNTTIDSPATTKLINDNAARINGDSRHPPTKYPVAPQRSTLSSTCSSGSSTTSPSTHPERAADSCCAPQPDPQLTAPTTTNSPTNQIMPDNAAAVSNSRSRRKRSRNQRKKIKTTTTTSRQLKIESVEECTAAGTSTPANDVIKQVHTVTETEEDYRVDWPSETTANQEISTHKKRTSKQSATFIKSKSLDDDEMVKIQELSEVSESEDKSDCNKAIVSEAESSDVEWDMTKDFPDSCSSLSTLSLPLVVHVTGQTTLISPEEELTLRNFLEGLNLVNSPEDSVKQVTQEKSTVESIKARKAKKRVALEQYFLPIAQNPRFLDVISEETSDVATMSEPKELPAGRHLKQGTPELELAHPKPPIYRRKNNRMQQRKLMQSHHCAPVSKAILLDTKIIEMPVIAQGIISSSEADTVSQPEVVYLEDDNSSSSSSSHASNRNSFNSDVCLGNDEETSDSTSSSNNLEAKTISKKFENVQQIVVTVKKNDSLVSQTNINTQVNSINDTLSELTPPPTPDNISPKNGTTFVESSTKTGIIPPEKIVDDTLVIKTVLASNANNSIELVAGSNSFGDKKSPISESAPALSSPVSSPSLSVSSESSRGTSLCTAKYNPMNSSIGDILSISKDEELLKKLPLPLSLRELCLSCLLSLPFGTDILQELADVSLSIESLTNKIPKNNILSNPHLPAFICRESKDDDDNHTSSLFNLPVNCASAKPMSTKNDNWSYIATEQDPKLLICLSPTQKSHLEKSEKIKNEAGKLLELHNKYMFRRSYDDDLMQKQIQNDVEITSMRSLVNPVNNDNNNNKLLTIIQNEPKTTSALHHPKKSESPNNPNSDYLFYEEKDNKLKSSHALSLPRHINKENPRLKARDLSEWLHLARNKSTSESSLPTIVEGSTNSRARTGITSRFTQRRTSLPQEFFERQMQYLLEKERDIQRELEYLEDEKRKLASEMAPSRQFQPDDYHISQKGDYAENKSKARPLSMPSATSEIFRQQMYEEYMDQVAAREERKQLKVIKVKNVDLEDGEAAKQAAGIEDEFMDKVKEKQKLGKLKLKSVESDREETIDEEDADPVLVIDGDSLKGSRKLPKHLQEFVDITKHASDPTNPENYNDDGVWSPGQKPDFSTPPSKVHQKNSRTANHCNDEPTSPVWTPRSAASSPTTERKEFKPIKYESPVLGRRNLSKPVIVENPAKEPPWKVPETSSDTGIALSSSLQKRLPTSHSSPASGFGDLTHRLPKAQNPTITLLQKAREGQLPRGASYIDQNPNSNQLRRPKNDKPPILGPGEFLYQVKSEYTSESDSERPRKMADLGSRKFEGIGPTTKDGMPLILRSEVKDANQSKWYKRMYDTIHKQRPHQDEYVAVKYKQRRGQYPYASGYLSEPEPGAYDSDFADYKYATLDRRRVPVREKENDHPMSSTMPRNTNSLNNNNNNISSSSSDLMHKNTQNNYQSPPGRIENYKTGHSSISDKEAKEWWDEVMDIFDGWMDDNSALPSYDYMFSRALAKSHLEQQKRGPPPKSFINQALKESGYESDSTLVFRRRDDTAQQLSPLEQKEAYKVIQKGGDVPLHGLRRAAPERPKDPEPPIPPPKGQRNPLRNPEIPESPRKYVENEVTIHYKTPVRQEIKEYLSEDELAYRQAEAMKKIYQEERRRKYLQVSKSLQELQDMNSRRHTDNFIPSQKSPISLNRYDDFEDLTPPVKPRPRSPEPRLMARALYNFVGQTARELTFRKGDLIYVRRQVDKNWYEGELNAMVGLFPVNYVEIITYDSSKSTPRKSHEGQARAKYNFVAQTHLELSLGKGELVIVTRKVDDNWYEGKIGGRKGIFPVAYVDLLIDPSDPPTPSGKPVASPAAHSLLLNGSAGGKESMGSHSYTPSLQQQSSYHAKPVQITTGGNYGSLQRSAKSPVGQTLHIETQSEPVPFRVLYKYLPQNDDELELLEGDTVYVLEKCDDGWYVGSSDRTGAFGTFPGNYVEKI